MRPLRIGFIGAGGNTRLRHLPGFAALADVELVAVANRTVKSANQVAAEFGIARVEADWQRIVDAPDIDAVCIGTWPNTHAPMTIAALAAGKHVLVEARMASSLAAAREMQAAAAATPHLVTQIVPSPLTLEADEIIRALVDSGELGELQAVHSEHATDATLDPTAPLSWRLDERISGINTMALGICYEPMQRWWSGHAVVSSAAGEIITPLRRDAAGREHSVKIPERLRVEGKWGNAAFSMMQSTVEPGPARCRYEVVGSLATLSYDVNARTLAVTDRANRRRDLAIPALPDGGWRVEADFVSSIRDGLPVTLTDFTTGLRYMEFTAAVWQASHGEL
jgi:predicted dehydrogenase